MVKHETLFNLLKQIQIPVAYDHFDSDKKVTPPFMVYRETEPETFKADNVTFRELKNYEIELVTSIKQPTLEEQISELLTNNEIPYDKNDEIWDKEEKIYHIYYEI